MLELRAVDAGYGQLSGLFAVISRLEAGEAVGVDCPERGRQDDLCGRSPGLIRTEPRLDQHGRRRTCWRTRRFAIVRPRHCPCAGEPVDLFPRLKVDDIEEMGGPPRSCRGVRAPDTRRLEVVFDLFFPPHEGTAAPSGRDPMSGGNSRFALRPRTNVWPKIVAARRTLTPAGLAPVRGCIRFSTGEADFARSGLTVLIVEQNCAARYCGWLIGPIWLEGRTFALRSACRRR